MGDKYRRTVSYARGQPISVSPGSTRVKPLVTGRNTFLVFQKRPTSSPDSASLVSQTVSYTFSARFRALTSFILSSDRSPLSTDSGNYSRIVRARTRPLGRVPLPREIIFLPQTLCARWICTRQSRYLGNETQMPKGGRGGSQGGQELRDRYACRSPPLRVGMNANTRQHQSGHRDEKVLRGSSQESGRTRAVLFL